SPPSPCSGRSGRAPASRPGWISSTAACAASEQGAGIAMATTPATSVASARMTMLMSAALLVVGFVPWPQRWAGVRAVIDSARSPELNRAEREAHAAGYYEGLIGGGDGPEGARGELALRLMGKPNGWIRFNDANVARMLPGDFLQ